MQQQQLQHKRFTMRNEGSALPIGKSYVPAITGFAAQGKMNEDDTTRPWLER